MGRTAKRRGDPTYPGNFPQHGEGHRYLGVMGLTHDPLSPYFHAPSPSKSDPEPDEDVVKDTTPKPGTVPATEDASDPANTRWTVWTEKNHNIVLDDGWLTETYSPMYDADLGEGFKAGVFDTHTYTGPEKNKRGDGSTQTDLAFVVYKPKDYEAWLNSPQDIKQLAVDRWQPNKSTIENVLGNPTQLTMWTAAVPDTIDLCFDVLSGRHKNTWRTWFSDIGWWIVNQFNLPVGNLFSVGLGDLAGTSLKTFLDLFFAYEGISGKKDTVPSLTSVKQAANDFLYSIWYRPDKRK